MEVTAEVTPRVVEYDKELGLVEVVQQKKQVELSEFENEVTANQSEFDDATGALDEAENEYQVLAERIEELKKEKEAAEVALSNSKSYFEHVSRLVAESTAGVDDGSSAASDSMESGEAQEIAVNVVPEF